MITSAHWPLSDVSFSSGKCKLLALEVFCLWAWNYSSNMLLLSRADSLQDNYNVCTNNCNGPTINFLGVKVIFFLLSF